MNNDLKRYAWFEGDRLVSHSTGEIDHNDVYRPPIYIFWPGRDLIVETGDSSVIFNDPRFGDESLSLLWLTVEEPTLFGPEPVRYLTINAEGQDIQTSVRAPMRLHELVEWLYSWVHSSFEPVMNRNGDPTTQASEEMSELVAYLLFLALL